MVCSLSLLTSTVTDGLLATHRTWQKPNVHLEVQANVYGILFDTVML